MTKEELEKEVEKYLEKTHCKNVCTYIEECKIGIRIRCMSFNYRKELIFNFAEPREKRIAELEAQIEEMKCCGNCKFKDCDKSNRYQTCWYCKNKDKWKLRR